MDQVGTTALASTVSLSGQQWGTYIDLNCVCLAPVTAHHDKLAMVVVSRDGTHTQLATWVADPGHTAKLAGSISTPVDQITRCRSFPPTTETCCCNALSEHPSHNMIPARNG